METLAPQTERKPSQALSAGLRIGYERSAQLSEAGFGKGSHPNDNKQAP
jgi:hypothetical protein